MCAKILCRFAKTEKRVSLVEQAQDMAGQMVRRESRGNGDLENAMRRLEQRWGIPWRVFWSLKYRPPRDVMGEVYLKLKLAYEAECERQERLVRHERDITAAKGGFAAALVGAADALAGTKNEDVK